MKSRLRQRQYALAILWALLFAKCFLLEYWVLVYAVPINSVVYVWGLSLFMATVASGVYLNLARVEQGGLHFRSWSAVIWAICFGLIALCALSGFMFEAINLDRFPVIAALIIGGGYIVQYQNQREKTTLYSALAWLLWVGLLSVLASPLPLLFFSLGLILFTAAPACIVYFGLRRKNSLAGAGRSHLSYEI